MIAAIIQARLNSTRLPRKVLLPFNGHTILEEVISQVKKSKVDNVVLATPDRKLAVFAPSMGVKHYLWEGDENDLISRYYHAANKFNADPIVRICADCPLILPEVINLVIREYFEHQWHTDYVYNRCDDSPGNWADGYDCEVFSYRALQRAYILADKREHFTWLKDNGTAYQVPPDKDYGECTSVNTKEDYEKALKILNNRKMN